VGTCNIGTSFRVFVRCPCQI